MPDQIRRRVARIGRRGAAMARGPRTRVVRSAMAVCVALGLVAAGPAAADMLASSPWDRGAPVPVTKGWCADQSKLVVIGDSSATGYGSTGYGAGQDGGYEPTEYGWAARLDRQLPNTRLVNLARNGALAADFLPGGRWPLTASRLSGASMVIIAVGANDYGINRPPAEFRSHLEQLTATIVAAVPQASLLFVHTWGFDMRWPWYPGPLHDWSAYGDQMAALAGVHYLDLTQVMPWADRDTAGLYTENEYGEYSVHPTDAGHQVEFAAYWSALRC